MNISNLKKKIEEKNIALNELVKQHDKELKKFFPFKREKKISEIEKKISALNEEIASLEKSLEGKLEEKKTADQRMNNIASTARRHGWKAGIGIAAVCLAYTGYQPFKPLTVNGVQTTYLSAIQSYENTEVRAADYTPETYERYKHNLEDAGAQKSNLFMSDEEKLKYIGAVSDAYEDLELIPDKTTLLSALNEADKYDISAYTPASAKEFKSAVSEIRAVYNDLNATKKEVTSAEKTLASAYLLLTEKADKTALNELLNQYSGYTLDEYTPSSIKSFNELIQNSEKLADDENASQDTVDKQVQKMQTADTLLVRKADKSSLQSLIDEYSSLNGDNYKSGYDVLKSEVEASASLLSNEDVSQEDVDSAVSRLQTAGSGLVEYSTYVYRVNMRAVQQSNNSVGNEWSYARYYNGISTHDGFEISGNPDTDIWVEMQITENDSYPDVGYGGTTIYLQDGYQTSFDVMVVENRGRYAGNAAIFTVNVSVTFLRRE